MKNEDSSPEIPSSRSVFRKRRSGLLYLSVIVFGIFAELTRQSIITWDDPAGTAEKIMEMEIMYRLALISDLIMITSFLFLALSLYDDFRNIDQKNSQVFLILVVVCVPILTLNTLNHAAPLIILSDNQLFTGYSVEEKYDLVLFFLNLHLTGYYLAQVSFGLWLLPLGLVCLKSPSIPKLIGYLLIAATIGHIIEILGFFLLPNNSALISNIVALPIILGEFGFAFWILIKGIPIHMDEA